MRNTFQAVQETTIFKTVMLSSPWTSEVVSAFDAIEIRGGLFGLGSSGIAKDAGKYDRPVYFFAILA